MSGTRSSARFSERCCSSSRSKSAARCCSKCPSPPSRAMSYPAGRRGAGTGRRMPQTAEEAIPDFGAVLPKADAAHGQQVSQRCQQCHDLSKGGPDKIGPNLWGIVGRPRASRASFSYSSAMMANHDPWTFEKLFVYLKSPATMVPGTKMTFAGISQREQDRVDPDRLSAHAVRSRRFRSRRPLRPRLLQRRQRRRQLPDKPHSRWWHCACDNGFRRRLPRQTLRRRQGRRRSNASSATTFPRADRTRSVPTLGASSSAARLPSRLQLFGRDGREPRSVDLRQTLRVPGIAADNGAGNEAMSFEGIKSSQQRINLLAYLRKYARGSPAAPPPLRVAREPRPPRGCRTGLKPPEKTCELAAMTTILLEPCPGRTGRMCGRRRSPSWRPIVQTVRA